MPHRHPRASNQVQTRGGFSWHDQRHGHGDAKRACRYFDARRFETWNHKLLRYVAHVGEAREEAQHVDMIYKPGMPLDDLSCCQPCKCGDITQIWCHLGVVANREPPSPTRPFGNLYPAYVRGNLFSERRL